jgi:hypothetical protein
MKTFINFRFFFHRKCRNLSYGMELGFYMIVMDLTITRKKLSLQLFVWKPTLKKQTKSISAWASSINNKENTI